MQQDRQRPPLVLIVNDQEWSTRSLESILGPNGFAVLRAYTGRKAFDRIRTTLPDLIVVDVNLPDMSGLSFCQDATRNALISPAIPVIVTTASHPSRAMRLEAMRAGAWDFLAHPFDAEELVLKLNRYVRAKMELDRYRESGMMDQDTGLYNMEGLARRGREVGSQAYRQRSSLSCVAFSIELDGGEPISQEQRGQIVKAVADAIKAAGRGSDVIGRIGDHEFGIIAPETDAEGAVRLAERLAEQILTQTSIESTAESPWHLRAGYDSVDDAFDAGIDPTSLLRRASDASRVSGRDPSSSWLTKFLQTT